MAQQTVSQSENFMEFKRFKVWRSFLLIDESVI